MSELITRERYFYLFVLRNDRIAKNDMYYRSATAVNDELYEVDTVSDDDSTTDANDDAVDAVDEPVNESDMTLEVAIAKYKESQEKLREAKQTIVSLIDQITDYQTVMDNEKSMLEQQLVQKEAEFVEEKKFMTQMIEEAERNQMKQNAETMYVVGQFVVLCRSRGILSRRSVFVNLTERIRTKPTTLSFRLIFGTPL
jgi:hypothetical protein